MTPLSIWVLAVEPHAHGLAFAAFAAGGDLVDWGSYDGRDCECSAMRQRCRRLVHELSPSIVGIEDVDQPDCVRSKRMRDLLRSVRQDVLDNGIAVVRVPRRLMRKRVKGLDRHSSTLYHLSDRSSEVQYLSAHRSTRAVPVRKAMRIGLAVIATRRKSNIS